ncbi:MAG: hypothetical protein ACYC40_03580 [Patescibacteria group bacterium]
MNRTLTKEGESMKKMEKFNLNLPAIKLLPVLQNSLKEIYKILGIANDEMSYAMSLFKAAHFIHLRNERSEDLMSPEIKEAMEIKAIYFKIGTPRFLICIDGRVLTMLIACLRGNSYHVPAGDTKIDFLPLKNGNGQLFLKKGFLSGMIDRVIKEQGCLHEVLDSHLHCAAGGLGAADRHCCEVADHGLWDDVVRKSEKKKAIVKYVNEKHPGATIFVTQMSFNPDDGYSFFGLDKAECLESSKETGYVNSVIDSLVEQNLIISTKKLAEEDFKEIFSKYFFVCDYPNDYRNSTKTFWNNFNLMSSEIMPALEEKIKKILSLDDEKEVKQTAALILASAYNGYLHNHKGDGSIKPYPYSDHRESVITVTISEKGPYSGAESFFVHPESLSISSDIKLGRNLIIGNRHKKRMSDLEIEAVNQVYGDNYTYSKSPVLAFFFQRTSHELAPEEIDKLQSIDWSDVIDTDWFDISNEEFVNCYLEKKWPGIPAKIAYTINRLRKQAVDIYAPNQEATEDFLAGRIIPIWAVACPNRRILSVIPFVINGYKE